MCLPCLCMFKESLRTKHSITAGYKCQSNSAEGLGASQLRQGRNTQNCTLSFAKEVPPGFPFPKNFSIICPSDSVRTTGCVYKARSRSREAYSSGVPHRQDLCSAWFPEHSFWGLSSNLVFDKQPGKFGDLTAVLMLSLTFNLHIKEA